MNIKKRRKFTLIELLIVMGIIAILASMLLPALGKARKKALSAVCKGNLKSITTAVYLYTDDYESYLPMARYTDGVDGVNWTTQLSTYIGTENTDWRVENTEPTPKVFECPAKDEKMLGYGWNWRYGGAYLPWGKYTKIGKNQNGLSVSESAFGLGGCNGDDVPRRRAYFWGSAGTFIYVSKRHYSGSNVFFMDGHVERLSYSFLSSDAAETILFNPTE